MPVHLAPELRHRQDDWERLYLNSSYDSLVRKSDEKVAWDADQLYLLCGIYFFDSLHGHNIEFPKTPLELKCLHLSRSAYVAAAFEFACGFYTMAPFLRTPYCRWNENSDRGDVSQMDSALRSLEGLCLLIFCFEFLLSMAVNNLKNGFSRIKIKDLWVVFRIFSFVMLLLEYFYSWTFPGFRVAAGLPPLMYVSRHKNLRQMLQGLISSISKTMPVLIIILMCIIFWSFMGFMLFRNFKTEEDNRFTDPVKSFLSVLHAYASRSFSMLLLDFMYAESQWTPLFFASLTVVADLLCSSLLISLGTRGYNSFATELYERRLRKRRNAALEIHRLLAVNGYMNLDSWLRLCKYMPQYDILQKYAAEIFLFECAESSSAIDMLDCRHFFRLLALASTDVFLFKQNQSQVSILGQPSDNAVGDRVVVNPLGAGGDQPTNGPSLGAEESSSKHQIPESSFAFRHDRYQKWCVMLLSHSVRIGESIEISPFKAFSKINQLLLFIFLIMYTSPNKTRDAWVISIWILEFLFVGEMLIKIIAFGRKAYLSTAINRGEFLINFATFIMLCFNNHDDNSAARVLLILASLCRYLWLFKVIPRFELFESLVPLFLHVGLLIFAIIYFFSAFAYVRFCDSMSVENATDTDDDSATWVRYEDILNFHTFGQSFHTLFQVSILGTWAMVLTTAAKEHPWAANLFFYPFRFIMVLTVYPLLFSFIIQAFALRDEKKIKDASEVEDKPSDTSPADATAEGNVVFGDIPMKVVEKNFLPLRPEEKSLLREEIKYFLCDIASNGYTPKCDYVKFADGAEVYSENTYLNYDSIFAQKIYPDRVSRSRRSDSRSAPSSHVSSLASSMIETNVLHISKMTNSDIDNTGMQLWIRPLSEKNADLQNALRREEILKNKLDMALFYLKMCSSASSKGPDDTDINEIQISQDT